MKYILQYLPKKHFRLFRQFLTLSIFGLSVAAMAQFAPGDLDSSFGTGGRVLTRFPIDSTTFRPRSNSNALAIQSDGKIVSAGQAMVNHSLGGETFAFAVVRYNTDGSLDNSFSGDGKLTTEIARNDTALAVALQPDGKIIAAGMAYLSADNYAFALVRYNSDGSLDTSFDGDGKVVTDITVNIDEITGVAVQPDGKIVAAGFVNGGVGATDFAVARYNTNGSLDTGFGTAGIVRTDFAGGIDGASELALLSDGRIVVAGTTYDAGGSGDFALVRYNADGSLDASFGIGGKVRTDFGQSESGADMDVAPDGKLVVAGSSGQPGVWDFAVARYNADGSLDTTFDGDGKFVNDFAGNGQLDLGSAVAVQQNGKIVVAGDATPFPVGGAYDFAVLRLNVDGSIDSSFGNNGKIFTDFGVLRPPGDGFTNDDLADVIIQPDGKIVVGGDAEIEPNRLHDTALARYLGDPVITQVHSPFDFDGDGKTDISIFRPAGGEWWWRRSSDLSVPAVQFGLGTDVVAPGDFTGDGKLDIAFFRPSDGFWNVLRSESFTYYAFPFGTNGDVLVTGDYDGDGKADVAVFRPSSSTWFIARSSDGGTTITGFGVAGDVPVTADYDGDGKNDIAIYRRNGPSGGEWWINRSTAGLLAMQFGAATDKTVPGDYTGDGKADIAFWRPSTGEWYIVRSEDSSFYAFPFGQNGDIPAPGDYDGDGKIDAAVFRNGTWFIAGSTSGTQIIGFGVPGDRPIPNSFVQ